MDTLKAIQVFVCIGQQGSLTKAADHLNVSRAMVSRYLEHLENHFSTRLFHRNTRKISLTAAGEQALHYCENILQQQQLLLDMTQDQQQTGMIRLTTGLFLLQNGLAECIQRFREQFPFVQFDIVITEDTLDLIDAQIDLAFRISPKIAEGLIARPLFPIDSVLCAHPDYLAQAPEIKHPEQLLQHTCLTHHSMHSVWTLNAPNQHPQNYNLHSVIKSNDAYALLEMCKQAQGIAMLPTALVQTELNQNWLHQILPDYALPQMQLSVVYSSRRHLSKKTQEFIAFVIQHFNLSEKK